MASKSKKKTPAIDVPGIAAACDALSCDVRAAVVAHLSRTGPADVGTLQQATGTSVSGVSQHLAKLKAAGVVTVRRDAQRMIYSLAPGWVERLVGKLLGMVGDSNEFVTDGTTVEAVSRSRSVPGVKENAKKRNPILLGAAEVTPIAQLGGDLNKEREQLAVLVVTASEGDVKPKSRKKSSKKQADKRPDATATDEVSAADAEQAQTAEDRPDAQESQMDDHVHYDPEVIPDRDEESQDTDSTGTTYAPERGW